MKKLWVNVKKKMPKECTIYLVYGPSIGINMAYWFKCGNEYMWASYGETFNCDNISHWMPIEYPEN